ncbi:MAG: hypothetical protein H3C26_00380 [Rhodocyclaceae bacterium]|nr:hypothetical protein [Rhodocyclaceae bacterium]
MNPISIERFWKAGGQAGEGDVRIARGNENTLVNKGTLGHRMASAIQGFARSIGLMRPDTTRAQRQQQAMDSFAASLRNRYGKANAEVALQRAGLDQDGARLTGRAIRSAILAAEGRRDATGLSNLAGMQKFLPPTAGNTPSDAFRTLVTQLDPGLDAERLDPQVAKVYAQRLQEAVREEGRMGRESISPQDLGDLARSTLKSVLKLHQAGRLEASVQARADYRDALGAWIRDVAGGRDAGRVMDRMTTALKAFDKLSATERLDEVGGGEFHMLTRIAISSFMASLGDPAASARHALGKTLMDGSALRETVACIDKLITTTIMQPEPTTQAGRMKALASNLVQALGVRGAFTGASGDDLDLLGTASSKSGRPSTQVMQQLLTRLDAVPTGAQALIDTIVLSRSGIDPETGIPEWHDQETLEQLEVLLHCAQGAVGKPMAALIDEFKAALETRSDLPPGLRDKLHAGVEVLRGQLALGAALDNTPGFPRLPDERLWQLFSTAGQRSDPKFSAWSLEHFNQGSVGGLQQAFTRMLEDRHNGVALDAGWLEGIHREATRDNFRTEALAMTYREDVRQSPAMMESILSMARISPGYRMDQTDLALRLDTDTTPQGRAELQALGGNDPWFGDMEVGGTLSTNTLLMKMPQPPDPEAAKQRAAAILTAFHEEMGRAQNDDDKLLAVARATQALYRSHLFEDGNTRSVVFIAMNRMLLDAGLPPAVLDNPKAAAGFGLEEFARHIREGQQHLASMA